MTTKKEYKKQIKELNHNFKNKNFQLIQTIEEREKLREALNMEWSKRGFTRWQHFKIAIGLMPK